MIPRIARPAALLIAALAGAPAFGGDAPLSLSALLDEADASSPWIRAAEARVAAAETLPSQAAARPDPVVAVSLENEGIDSWSVGETPMSVLAFSWSREVPYRGKRALRAEAARAEVAVAAADQDRVRAELRARVKAAYVDLHRVHRMRALVAESRALLATLRDAARARFETGGAPLEGALAAGAEVARLDVELAALEGERAEIEARLAGLLGRRAAGPLGPAIDPPVEATFDGAALVEAAGSAPRVAGLRATSRREEARIASLAREGKPDFSWSAGYGYRGSLDPMVSGMFGVRLPLSRDAKQRQAVLEAERTLEAARAETEAVEVETAAGVREMLARAAAAEAGTRTLQDAVLPQARAALEAATAAYASGRADFGTVLGHARALLDDASRVEALRAQRLVALALLEPSVGRELILPSGDRP